MGTWGYTFKPQTREMTKRSHDKNEKLYIWCAFCLFLVTTALLMSFEIYYVTFEEMVYVFSHS